MISILRFRPIVILICFLMLAIASNVIAQQQPSQSPPPPQPHHTSQLNQEWLDAVVSIETEVVDPATHGKRWVPIGTGFLIQTNFNHVVLVTAKHVVFADDGILRSDLGYRLSGLSKDTLVTEALLKAGGLGDWTASQSEDAALRFFAVPRGIDMKTIPQNFFIDPDTLEPGAPLVVLGFPLGHRSETLSRAIARRGTLAGIEQGHYIIDAFVFPGNSGGPVIYLPPFRLLPALLVEASPFIEEEKLIGIVTDFIPYTDYAISPQTQRVRVTFEENSGLAHVTSVAAIRDLLRDPTVSARDQALPLQTP
jgi:S1-C subfamily serine protease